MHLGTKMKPLRTIPNSGLMFHGGDEGSCLYHYYCLCLGALWNVPVEMCVSCIHIKHGTMVEGGSLHTNVGKNSLPLHITKMYRPCKLQICFVNIYSNITCLNKRLGWHTHSSGDFYTINKDTHNVFFFNTIEKRLFFALWLNWFPTRGFF